MSNLLEILDTILETKSYKDIATEINVAIGTVKRWKDLEKVPKQYSFGLMKLANIPIDYSKFTYREKTNSLLRVIQQNIAMINVLKL